MGNSELDSTIENLPSEAIDLKDRRKNLTLCERMIHGYEPRRFTIYFEERYLGSLR